MIKCILNNNIILYFNTRIHNIHIIFVDLRVSLLHIQNAVLYYYLL